MGYRSFVASQLSPHIQVSLTHTHLHAYRQKHKQPKGLENIHKNLYNYTHTYTHKTAPWLRKVLNKTTIIYKIDKNIGTLRRKNMHIAHPANTPMLLSDHCGHYSQNSLYTTHIQFIHDTYTILQIYKTIANTRIINLYGYRCYDSGKHQWLTTQESISGWQAYSLFNVFSYTTSIFGNNAYK